MSSPPSPILLLGAGTLGLPILHALSRSPARHSTRITLASRNPHSPTLAPLLSQHNITPLPLDIKSSSLLTLTALFRGFSTVISCAGMALPPGTQLKLARAVLEAGVRRYFPWQFGVDYDKIAAAGGSKQDLFAEQMEVRALLRGQGAVKWVVLSTGVFADFLVGEGFGVVEGEGEGGVVVRALGGWGNRVAATDVGDIARCVEELVFGDGGVEVQGVVFVAGQTVSYEDVAEAVERKVGAGRVRREVWTVEYLEEELRNDPGNGMLKYRAAFAEGTGVAWDEEGTWNRQKGLELTRVDDWVAKYLK